MAKMKRLGARGFTMPELVMAVILILVTLFTAMILLRPKQYDVETRNAQRRLDLVQLARAFDAYRQAEGHYPDNLPTSTTAIGSGDDMYNVCSLLVPKYIKDLPIDPVTGHKEDIIKNEETAMPCSELGVDYISGYSVQKNKDGSLTLALEIPEDTMIRFTTKP
jgi:type II secretory pathway pseudopilin PulG